MAKKILYVLLFFTVLLISGLLFSENVRLLILVPKVDKLEVLSGNIYYSTAQLNASLKVKNSFLFPLLIDSIGCDFKLEGKEIGNGGKAQMIKIGPLGNYTVLLPLNFKLPLLQKKLDKFRGKDAPFECHVTVLYDYPLLGKKTLSFLVTKPIKIPLLPEASMEKMELKSFGLNNMQLLARIKIKNNSDNAFDLTNIKYVIKIENNIDATGNISKLHHINPHGAIVVDVPVTADIKHVGNLIFKKIKGKKTWAYTLDANLDLKVSREGFENMHLNIKKAGVFTTKK